MGAKTNIISARNYYACPQSYLLMILSWFWGYLSNNSYMSGLHPVWQYGAILRAGWRQRYPGHTTHTEAHCDPLQPVILTFWLNVYIVYFHGSFHWILKFKILWFDDSSLRSVCLYFSIFRLPSSRHPAAKCLLYIFSVRPSTIIIVERT